MSDPEKLVKCPFNPLHRMSESSLQRHVIRCMVNYPNFVTCPYNALHRFENKDLLAQHMSLCDSKDKAEFYQMHDFKDSITTEVHIRDQTRNFNLDVENWDS